MVNSGLEDLLAHWVGPLRVPLALYPMAEATAPQGAHQVTISTPKGFHEELGFTKEEKKVPHPCQQCQHVSLSFSLFLCPRLPAIPLRFLQQGPTQQTHFLPLVSTSLSGGSPSLLL